MDGVERNVRDVQDCTMYRARLWFGAKLSAGFPARVQERGKEAQNNQAERQDDSQHSVISSETGLDNYNVDPNGTAWHTPGPAYMFWAYIFGRFSLPSLDLCAPSLYISLLLIMRLSLTGWPAYRTIPHTTCTTALHARVSRRRRE